MAVTKKQMARMLSEIESGVTAKLIKDGYDARRLMERYNVSRNTLHKYVKGIPAVKARLQESVFIDQLTPARRLALTLPWKTQCT